MPAPTPRREPPPLRGRPRRWLRRLGGRLAALPLAAAALAAPVGCVPPRIAPQLVTPGHTALRTPPLRGEIAYHLAAPPGTDSTRGPLPMGRTVVTETVVPHARGEALLRVLRVPERGLVDSLLMRRSDLAPIWEHERAPGRIILVDFDGARVRWTHERAGQPKRSGDTTYRVPVFAFNQLDVLVRALAAGPRMVAVVPMVSEASAEMEMDTIEVRQLRRTRARLRMADSAVVAWYVVEGPAREIVEHRVTMREGGARYPRVSDGSVRGAAPAREEQP